MESISDLDHSPELTEAPKFTKAPEYKVAVGLSPSAVEDDVSSKRPRTMPKEINPFRATNLKKIGEVATKLVDKSFRDPRQMWRQVSGFRVPRISPERLRANWEPTCFRDGKESDGETVNVKPSASKIKDKKVKSLQKMKPSEHDGSSTSSTDTSSSDSSTSTSSSESEKDVTSESEPECMDNVVHVEGPTPPRLRASNNYLINGAKTGRVELRKAIKAEKKEKEMQPPSVPLFTKPLELEDVQIKYLDAKCDGTDEQGLVKPSRKEQQRNMAAMREMRQRDWEKRRERREKRRMQFKLEREREELQMLKEADNEGEDEFIPSANDE